VNIPRVQLLKALRAHGIECRPIVAGNFAKNEVCALMDHSIHRSLPNADHIDSHGLFIGNHHYPLAAPMEALSVALEEGLRGAAQ